MGAGRFATCRLILLCQSQVGVTNVINVVKGNKHINLRKRQLSIAIKAINSIDILCLTYS